MPETPTPEAMRAEAEIERNFDLRTWSGSSRIAAIIDRKHAALRERLEKSERERDERQAFKDWVHRYLDTHGVPHHPPGTHGAAGCRIGDRMDWLMAKLRGLEANQEAIIRHHGIEGYDAIGGVCKLKADLAAANRRAEEAEAQAAAMRVALTNHETTALLPIKDGFQSALHLQEWAAASIAAQYGQAGSALLAELERLHAAIKKHHEQKADDRCWLDDVELYKAAGLPIHDPWVGSKEAMFENCKRFIEQRCMRGGWQSYAELEIERDRLRAERERLEQETVQLQRRLDARGQQVEELRAAGLKITTVLDQNLRTNAYPVIVATDELRAVLAKQPNPLK